MGLTTGRRWRNIGFMLELTSKACRSLAAVLAVTNENRTAPATGAVAPPGASGTNPIHRIP
jgi:hypothetical protein